MALAGHRGDAAAARAGLDDDDAGVRATALAALDRAGSLDGPTLVAALGDPEAAVRRRAVQLAATHPEVDLSAALADPAPEVVEMAAWSSGERPAGDSTVVEALVGLATSHEDPLCREAAVAALGALGDPRGLAAILAGLDDRPPIRRRAVLALAPFDGPEVDAALHRMLDDRDRQVRQAAEDLLA